MALVQILAETAHTDCATAFPVHERDTGLLWSKDRHGSGIAHYAAAHGRTDVLEFLAATAPELVSGHGIEPKPVSGHGSESESVKAQGSEPESVSGRGSESKSVSGH